LLPGVGVASVAGDQSGVQLFPGVGVASVAGDQSGVQLLPGVGVASAESAVISRSLLGCYRRGCANSTLRKTIS